MTDSMNFGPEWLRNQISSDGSSTGIGAGGTRYQLADYRYGREEMLALFEKELRAPNSLSTFPALYSEISLPPVALSPVIDDNERHWATRGPPMGPAVRGGRGAVGPGERGGRIARGGGRGGTFQTYSVRPGTFETGGGWGNGEQSDWSPRKEFNYNRSASSGGGVDNWRRCRNDELADGWRNTGPQGRGGTSSEKWTRTSSWREGDDDRGGPVDKMNRSWNEVSHSRGPMNQRRGFENDDHLPEWVTENLGGGGTFDSSGAFHGSDEEQELKVYRRENNLQKSISQQNISSKSQQHVPLSTSKSALSLSKPPEPPSTNANVVESVNHVHENEKLKAIEEKEVMAVKEHGTNNKNKIPIEVIKQSVLPKPQKQTQQIIQQEEANNVAMKGNMNQNSVIDDVGNRVVDEEFEKLQEDLVLKLVVDEEPPTNSPLVTHSNGLPPPPNMMPIQDKWFYQDPQGDLQGPFLSTEMAEWFRAGYFTTTLYVRRQCDERFYTLGDLVSVCGGGNPFQTFVLAPQKKEKVPDDIQFQYAQQQAMRAAAVNRPFGQGEPWNAINPIQQRELLNQQMMQHYMADTIMLPTNQVHPMRQQILKVNKLAVNPSLEKQPNPIPLDPLQALVHQMGGLQSMQPNRMHVKPNMPHNMSGPPPMKHDVLPSPATLHGIPMNGGGIPIILQNNLIPQNNQIPPSAIPKQPGVNKMDGDNNINMLHYLQQKPPVEQQPPNMDLDIFWKTQFGNPQQHMQQPSQLLPPWPATDKPISMWDMPQSGPANMSSAPPEIHQINNENINIKDNHKSDVNNDAIAAAAIAAAKEEKKRKEQEEKQAKKDAEEKRKMEQRKQEAEKKLQEEKRKKEDDRVKKEMEKVKKEAEEKRQRELAEKRRLKEKRKADEEARKKAEELRKLEEQEREKLAAKEREEQQKKQAEFARQQAINNQNWGKTAPWSQSSSNQGLSLSEIQKLERERKAEQVALLQQQRVLQMQEQAPEKPTNIQLSWANKPMKASNVKSLAEIQAEEQEKCQNMVKQQASLQHKEKETKIAAGIWSGQSLTWTNNHDTSGFWEEPPQRQSASKVNNVQDTTKTVTPKQTPKSQKSKVNKKDEHPNNSNSSTDEFTEWCTKTLANMNTTVDIPTFISFLRDIESAMDVRDYCREYLGEKPAIQQFAAQFLEKRRLFKPKVTTHKDDLCSPAPAITPSVHNNSDFQEVKSKGRKCKRKMLKVDSRILGFNVTAAQDRINVGDRDYGVHEGEGGKKLSSFLRQGGANLDSGICWADGPLAL